MTNFVTRVTQNRIREGSGTWVVIGTAGLAAFAPLGQEATHPAVFLGYRLVLIAMTALCLWVIGGESGPDLPSRYYLGGGLVLALMLLSVWSSPGKNPTGVISWYEHFLFALFFVALARFSARQSARWKQCLLGLLVLITLIHFLISLSAQGRFDNVFGNSNHLAAYLVVGFATAIAAALFGQDLKWRILASGAAVVLFYGITTTLSRGATLAAIGVIGLAVLKIERRMVLVMIGGVTLVAAIGVAVSNPMLIQRFTDRGEIDPYNYQRTDIWLSTAEMIRESPVLGVGLSRYDDVARRFRPPSEGTIGRYMKRQAIAHNEYLQYAAESGIPALILILALLGALFRQLWHGKSTVRSPDYSLVNERAALLVTAGVLAHGLVDNMFTVPVLVAAIGVVALASSPLTASGRTWIPTTGAGQLTLATTILVLVLSSTALPATAYAINRSGQNSLADGDIRSAERAQRLALAVASNDAQLMLNMGLVYKEEFDRFDDPHLLDMAEAYIQSAAEANPTFLQPRLEYVDTLLSRLTGDGLIDTPMHAKIAEANEAILELDPFLPTAGMNLAEAYYQSGRRDDAFEQLRHTIELEPNLVPAYFTLAEWYQVEGDEARRQELLRAGLAIIDRYSARNDLTDYESIILGRP
jgi:O-antigen ligase